MSKESHKVVYVAIVTNLAISVSKFAVATITGSAAMLAEAFHSTADTGNEVLLLIGLKRSARPADQEHPFGHGRALYFWAFIVAISIFAVGGGLSVYEGINRLLHPEPLQDAMWSYIVLGAAAVFEAVSWVVGLKAVNGQRNPDESLIRAIERSKDPAIFTVFIEDSAALVGLAIAFLGVFTSHLLGLAQLDSIASILIGLVLIGAAFVLGRETAGLLLGESTDLSTVRSVRGIISSDEAVQYVTNVLTMQLAPDEVLLVADVSFRPQLGTAQLETAIDRIEANIQEKYPSIKRIYFEAESLKGGSRAA